MASHTRTAIRALEFKASQVRNDYEPVYPNPLFRLISNTATDDVAGFLRFVGEPSSTEEPGVIPASLTCLTVSGRVIFEAYVTFRESQHLWQRHKDGGRQGEGMAAKCKRFERMSNWTTG